MLHSYVFIPDCRSFLSDLMFSQRNNDGTSQVNILVMFLLNTASVWIEVEGNLVTGCHDWCFHPVESDDEEEDTMEEEEETEEIGMEYLIHPEKDEQPIKV